MSTTLTPEAMATAYVAEVFCINHTAQDVLDHLYGDQCNTADIVYEINETIGGGTIADGPEWGRYQRAVELVAVMLTTMMDWELPR